MGCGLLFPGLGDEVDDQGLADLFDLGSEFAKRQQRQQKQQVDGKRQLKADGTAPERRAFVGRGETVIGQGLFGRPGDLRRGLPDLARRDVNWK